MIEIDNATISRLAWTLIHFLWQGFAVYGLFCGFENAVRGRRAQARYLFALGSLALMAACPLVTWQFLGDEVSAVVVAQAPVEQDVASESSVILATGGSAELPAAIEAQFDWQLSLLCAWLVGVLFFGSRLVLGLIGISRWQRQKNPLDADWIDRMLQLCERMEMPRFRRVFQSNVVAEAMAVGFFRPFVLIPTAWLAEMPVSVLEAVIAHELAHIRRGDLWINGLQRVMESILFYHPAVWWLSARVREEREMCCDETAAQVMGRQLDYARALEFVARRSSANHALLTASFSGDESMSVLRRVRNVLGIAPAARNTVLWPVAALMLAVCGWFVATTNADDERPPREGDRPPAERAETPPADRKPDGPREEGRRPDGPRDGERRPDGPRDGEKRPEGPRDGERRPDGPRDGERRPDGPRDGDPRPDGPRDGERRPDGPRDGERRPDGPRDGDRRPEGEFGRPPRDGEGRRPPVGEEELRREVERLRREIQELRDMIARERADRRPERDGDFPPRDRRFEGERPRDGRPPREGDRPFPPREGERRPEGERFREGRPPRDGEGRRPRPEDGDRPREERETERPQRPE